MTTCEFSRRRSNTICFPSLVMSKVRMPARFCHRCAQLQTVRMAEDAYRFQPWDYFWLGHNPLGTACNFDSACNSCGFPKVCRMDPFSPVIQIGAENPRRLASRREKEKTDAVCPNDLPHTGRVRHAEE